MSLTKLPRPDVIPGTAGQNYRAEYTVWTPEPPPPGDDTTPGGGGHWETVCDSVAVPMGYCTQAMIQYGQCSVLGPMYGYVQVCRSVWVGD